MTVFACILCFITGALTVLAAQICLPRPRSHTAPHRAAPPAAPTTADTARRRETSNFLCYDGSEQPAGQSL